MKAMASCSWNITLEHCKYGIKLDKNAFSEHEEVIGHFSDLVPEKGYFTGGIFSGLKNDRRIDEESK